jgi:competence protein ComEA
MSKEIKNAIFFVVSLLMICSGSLFAVELDIPTVDPVSVEVATININTASVQDLADGLKGVGIKTAEAIVDHRDELGSFSSAEEIMDVSGIGEITFALNKDIIVVE